MSPFVNDEIDGKRPSHSDQSKRKFAASFAFIMVTLCMLSLAAIPTELDRLWHVRRAHQHVSNAFLYLYSCLAAATGMLGVVAVRRKLVRNTEMSPVYALFLSTGIVILGIIGEMVMIYGIHSLSRR
jgi:hypothetical protein